jgi:type III secretory pathway lipoprotein EscJ
VDVHVFVACACKLFDLHTNLHEDLTSGMASLVVQSGVDVRKFGVGVANY